MKRALLPLALALLAVPAAARRLPGPGGKITVALPAELVTPTTEAHLYAPLVEPAIEGDPAAALARPPIPGFPAWRSSVLRALASEEGGAVWKLSTDAASASLVAESVARCFSKRTEGSWPSDALRARNVGVDVSVASSSAGGADVRVKFSEPVGPVAELLAGCVLRTTSSAQPTGSYTVGSSGGLVWKSSAFGPPPLLGHVEITTAPTPALPSVTGPPWSSPGPPFTSSGGRLAGDLVAFGSESPGSATLLAPFPDVLVLLQSRAARDSDVLGLFDTRSPRGSLGAGLGTRGFRQALRADLLAAAYAQGRGAVADGLLPPGVAPARPLPEPQGPEKLAPLTLAQLPADAPRLVVRRGEGDQLVDGVVERLAVILRTRGVLVDVRRSGADGPDGVELLRWRPPSSDPALALLSLAGQRPELVDHDAAKRALGDARLLSASPEERVAAAVALERAWLDAGLAVPLMTADRWFTADPELRGVVIREDGVPLLWDATFGGPR